MNITLPANTNDLNIEINSKQHVNPKQHKERKNALKQYPRWTAYSSRLFVTKFIVNLSCYIGDRLENYFLNILKGFENKKQIVL